jgi:hypothetical protein
MRAIHLADCLKTRHTPNIGIVEPKDLIISQEIPASFGDPGPGEMTIPAGFLAAISVSST